MLSWTADFNDVPYVRYTTAMILEDEGTSLFSVLSASYKNYTYMKVIDTSLIQYNWDERISNTVCI